MTLEEKIAVALKEHDEGVMTCPSYKNDESRAFVIKQVHYATEQVLYLAREIRNNINLRSWKNHGRVPDNVMQEMLAMGQPFTSFLFLANLRDKITDPIEYQYGVSFSSLGIYPEWIDTTDNWTVFALYYHTEWPNESMTLVKNGEVYFGKNSEYGTRYVRKEYE